MRLSSSRNLRSLLRTSICCQAKREILSTWISKLSLSSYVTPRTFRWFGTVTCIRDRGIYRKYRCRGSWQTLVAWTGDWSWWNTGLCLTIVTWRCRKNFSQRECSFHRKLRCHWLKFLRQRHIAVVRQGPGLPLSARKISLFIHAGLKSNYVSKRVPWCFAVDESWVA